MRESEKRDQQMFEYYLAEWQDEFRKRGLKYHSKGTSKADDKDLYSITVQIVSSGKQFTGSGSDWKEAFSDAVRMYEMYKTRHPDYFPQGGTETDKKSIYAKVKQAASSRNFWGIEPAELNFFIENIQDEDFELAARVR